MRHLDIGGVVGDGSRTSGGQVRITITGARGMLGRELSRALADRAPVLLDHSNCDITDPVVTWQRLAEARPDVVIHLAAFTKVNECQRNPERAMAVNAQGTKNVATVASALGARFVYISTDYVFDGHKRDPYLESDPIGPVNVYGRSKAAGEAYAARQPESLIIRCGWLFGAGGRNFVEAIREQLRKGNPLRVVDDQRGTPIWTRHLAPTIVALVDNGVPGIVHTPATGDCTWHEFAAAISEMTGGKAPVEAITTPKGDTPRPAYSVLSGERLRSLGIGPLPHWREGLLEYLRDSDPDQRTAVNTRLS